MRNTILKTLLMASLILCIAGAAFAAPIRTTVSAQTNLYKGWLNPSSLPSWTSTWSEYEKGNLINGSSGVAAVLVDYAFSTGEALNIVSSGILTYNVPANTLQYGPDGQSGGIFRNNPTYSLIGVWSSSKDAIMPISLASTNPAFYIGSTASLITPHFTSGSAWLWLGLNDGRFDDNGGAGITVTTTPVPLPSSGLLLGVGLLGLAAIRRRSI